MASQQSLPFEGTHDLGCHNPVRACLLGDLLWGRLPVDPTAARRRNWLDVSPSGRSRLSNSARQVNATWCNQNPADSMDRNRR